MSDQSQGDPDWIDTVFAAVVLGVVMWLLQMTGGRLW